MPVPTLKSVVDLRLNPFRKSGTGRFGVWPVVLAGLLVFLPTLGSYFTGEDFVFIRFATTGHPFYQPSQNLFYRPLPNLLWQLDGLLWGLKAGGYHLTNLMLHLINIGLVCRLAAQMGATQLTSRVAGLLFAVHPLHIEPVAWVAGRPDLLATVFGLLCLSVMHDYFKGGPRAGRYYLAGWLSFGLAMLSKESVLALPLMLVLWGSWLTRPANRRQWANLVMKIGPFGLLLLAFGLVRLAVLGTLGGYSSNGIGLLRIAWNATLGLWLPLLFPVNFESGGWPVGGGLALVWLTFYGWLAIRNRRQLAKVSAYGLVSFGLIYIALLPALNNAPIGLDLAQSRILYLPSVGFCLLLAQWLTGGPPVLVRLKVAGLVLSGVAGCALALWPWWQASQVLADSLELLARQSLPLAAGDAIYYEGLPDIYRGAYIWRNGLNEATALLLNSQIEGWRRTPDLLVDYRVSQQGRLWFVRYEFKENLPSLNYVFTYSVSGETDPAPVEHRQDFGQCRSGGGGWQLQLIGGELECVAGQGWQVNQNQKGGLNLASPVINRSNRRLSVDLAANLDYDFQQSQVFSEVRLTDPQGRLLYSQPFEMVSDGKLHRYHLMLTVPVEPGPIIINIRLSKFRNNILWQAAGWSEG